MLVKPPRPLTTMNFGRRYLIKAAGVWVTVLCLLVCRHLRPVACVAAHAVRCSSASYSLRCGSPGGSPHPCLWLVNALLHVMREGKVKLGGHISIQPRHRLSLICTFAALLLRLRLSTEVAAAVVSHRCWCWMTGKPRWNSHLCCLTAPHVRHV